MYRVLIADDDYGMRLFLKKAIEKNENFMIEAEAENGAQALELLADLAGEEEADMDAFLKALQGGEEADS